MGFSAQDDQYVVNIKKLLVNIKKVDQLRVMQHLIHICTFKNKAHWEVAKDCDFWPCLEITFVDFTTVC